MQERGIDFWQKNKITVLLFGYHLVFIAMAYFLRVKRGTSDAHLYWGKRLDITQNEWFDFASYGTDFMLFLNYPLIKLGFPFWSGFLIYGIVGFFGILKWMQWIEVVLGRTFEVKGINVLPFFFFLSNLHVWTSSLGKEALVFWGIASVFYAFAVKKYKSLGVIAGILIVLIIRPHVALMLITSIVIVLFFNYGYSLKKRLAIAGISSLILATLVYMVLQLSQIRYLNWTRIKRYNDFSILSFENSGSYVPMLDYNYGYKLFSFNFRPLFYDARSFMHYLASLENGLVLLLSVIALFFLGKHYRNMIFPSWVKMASLFAVISSLLFVQRYANLGIFMRTKMMFQPFLLIAFLFIIRQGLALKNSKS